MKSKLENYASKYVEAKRRLHELPGAIEKLKVQETEAMTVAFLGDADNQTGEDLKQRREAAQNEEVELRAMLPGIRLKLFDEARQAGEKAKEDVLSAGPDLKKQLEEAQNRLESAVAAVVEAAVSVYGKDRAQKALAELTVVYIKKHQARLPAGLGIKHEVDSLGQQADRAGSFDQIMKNVLSADELQELRDCMRAEQQRKLAEAGGPRAAWIEMWER